MSVTIRVLDGMVYRKGSSTDLSMTPRPEEDVTSDLKEAGLSTWRELATAIPIGEKGQKIDLAKLDPAVLGCFQDEDGHVSIVPIDQAGNLDMIKLMEWAASRGQATPHAYTTMVVKAIVEFNLRRPT